MMVVTGAAGFIGSATATALASRGVEVVGVDRRPAPTARPHVVADLADDRPAVRDLLGAAEVVVHLAARPGVRDRSPDIVRDRHRDNVIATRHVLAAARGAVIAVSSSSVYGGAAGGRASHEDDERRPIGGYARSKVAAEDVCHQRRASGAAVCVVRPFTVIGPGQRPGMAVDRWLRTALAGGPIEIFGSAARSRDLTTIDDVAHALVELATRAADRRALPDVLNLGTGTAHPLGEIAAAVERAVPGARTIRVAPDGEPEPDHTLADTRRLAATLGWVPVTDLDAVIARQLADLRTGDRGDLLEAVGN